MAGGDRRGSAGTSGIAFHWLHKSPLNLLKSLVATVISTMDNYYYLAIEPTQKKHLFGQKLGGNCA